MKRCLRLVALVVVVVMPTLATADDITVEERKQVRELVAEYKSARTEDSRRKEIVAAVLEFQDDSVLIFYKQIRRVLQPSFVAYGKEFIANVDWKTETPEQVLAASEDLAALRQKLVEQGDLDLPLRQRLADELAEDEATTNSKLPPLPGAETYEQFLHGQEEQAIKNWVAAATAAGPDPQEAVVVQQMNEMRKTMGLQPLEIDMRLVLAARDHSSDMQKHDFFSHTSPLEGKATFSDRAKRFGYPRPTGENIYLGSPEGSAAFTGWKNSPPHYKNMVSPDHTKVGVGRHGKHWTQLFGR